MHFHWQTIATISVFSEAKHFPKPIRVATFFAVFSAPPNRHGTVFKQRTKNKPSNTRIVSGVDVGYGNQAAFTAVSSTYNSGTGFPFLLLFLSPPPPPSAAPHHGHANIPDSVRYMPPSKPVGQHRNDVIWATLATTTRHVAAFEVDNRRMRPSESDDLIRCAHVSRSREEQAAAPRKQ